MRELFDGLSPVAKDEMEAQLRDLSGGPLSAAFKLVREELIETLVKEPTYSLTAVDAHASLRVLERVEQELLAAIANLRANQRKRA